MLLSDWFIRLKSSIINILLQIVCFLETLNVSYMEYFINSSMFCSVSLMFTTLLRNQVECLFLALLCCLHLHASCWFSRDMLSITKSLPKNFKFESSWDLLPRFFCLYMTDCFGLQHLNVIITVRPFHSMASMQIFRNNVNLC